MPTTYTLLNGRKLEAIHKNDGTEVQVSFETDQGEIVVASTPEGIMNLAAAMSEVAAHALAIKSRAEGHQVINVAHIADAKAETPKGAPIVAIALKGTNGSVQHFGLQPETSAALRPQMEAAEKQARENLKKKLS